MKRAIVSAALLLAFSVASAAHGGLGVGLIAGEPNGLCAKQWAGEFAAFDAAVAWSVFDPPSLHVHADFLLHTFSLLKPSIGELPIYYGVGGRVRFEQQPRVGVRIPVGLSYIFDGVPLDVFLEIVPGFNLLPATGFDMDGAVGIRYYFQGHSG